MGSWSQQRFIRSPICWASPGHSSETDCREGLMPVATPMMMFIILRPAREAQEVWVLEGRALGVAEGLGRRGF